MKINFLKDIPKSNRNIEKRLKAKDPEVIKEAKKFGKLYWDGPRDYGYGGYKYDGRWIIPMTVCAVDEDQYDQDSDVGEYWDDMSGKRLGQDWSMRPVRRR